MVRKLFPLALLALLAFAFLSGCEQFGSTGAIIGSIFTNFSVSGGTEFHVLVLSSATILDPDVAGAVDSVSTVTRYDGSFPGSGGDLYYTTNYIITDVPEGIYYVFAWIDSDDSGTFDSGNDDYGFYNGYDTTSVQPQGANVIVPTAGAVDVDVYMIQIAQ